jgi:hypothetical protein
VAAKSPPAIPPPDLVTWETNCPLVVTSVTVDVALEDSTVRTIAIGMIQNSRNAVVTRSSRSG